MMGRLSVPVSCRLFLTTLCLVAFGLGAARAWGASETLTVNTLNDTADATNNCGGTGTGTACSLRDAIAQANTDGNGDTIVFKSGLTGTITLGSTLPTINVNLTITGPGANLLTISADHKAGVRVMTIGSSAPATVNISGLTIAYGNSSNGFGGGIFINQGALTVEECAFIGNFANDGGGAITDSSTATVTAIDSTFSGNSSSGPGGAINADGVTVSNSTFSDNSGQDGSAIAAGGTATVTNSTFSGNSSAASGGGALNISGVGTLTADNNIFSGNSGGAIYDYSGTANANYNVYYDNTGNGGSDCASCTSNGNAKDATANPLALPLGSYGGPTQTLLPQPGSAAICWGSSSDAPVGVTTDQRGFAFSPSYSSCPAGLVDAGAVQSNYLQVQASTDGTATSSDCPGTKCTLRDAVALANGEGDIDFAPGVASITLGSTLSLGLPPSTGTPAGINMIGPGANTLTINGGGTKSTYGVFAVEAGVPAVLYGMTISNGNAATATNLSTLGGGIENSGDLTLLSSAVTNNAAVGDGGGIDSDSTALIMDSTISGNTGSAGGGIYNGGTMEIAESTVSDNSASGGDILGFGGGISSDGTLMVVNSTIAGNSASGNPGGAGGGIYVASGSTSLANTIVAGNIAGTSSGGVGSNIENSYTDHGGNVIGGNTDSVTDYAGGDTTKPEITLSGLALIGPKATVPVEIPLPGSAAICAGEATNLLAGVTADERGEPNENTTYTGYSSSSPCVDAGAVQSNYAVSFSTKPPSSVTVDQGFGAAVTVDESGQAISGIDIPVTLSSGTLYGTTSETTDGSGVATYSGLNATAGTGLTLNVGVIPSTATNPLTVSSSAFDVTAILPSVGLNASTKSATLNQAVTLTATVSTNVTNPVAFADFVPLTGSVAFSVGSTAISCGSGSEAFTYDSTTGTATQTCVTSALPAGSPDSIAATYTPGASDTSYQNAASTPITIAVAQASTSTTVASSSGATNPTSAVNSPVTFTAVIDITGSVVVPPTGTITFTDNGSSTDAAMLDCGGGSGVTVTTIGSGGTTEYGATCTTSKLIGGTHTIVATYSGDSNYQASGSHSGSVNQTVTALATSTKASATPSPASFGESVTLSATVTPFDQPVPLAEAVSFTAGSSTTPLCTGTVDPTTGVASCSTTQLPRGTDTITATYPNGDPSYKSSSGQVGLDVNPATGTMALISSDNPSTVNAPVMYTAQVTVPSVNTPPAGTVGFSYTLSGSSTATPFSGCSAVGLTAPGPGGTAYTAACSPPPLTYGSYTITATYTTKNGNFSFNSGTNVVTLAQTVNPAATQTQVQSLADPSEVNQAVTFQATVTSKVPGSATPTGTVSFSDGTATICSDVPIAKGVYDCSTNGLAEGAQTITATFNPSDSNFSTSSGAVLQTVNMAATTLGLSGLPASVIAKNPKDQNDMVTFTATVNAPSGGIKPGGTVTFTYNGSLAIPECAAALPVGTGGTVSCTTSSLPAGADTVTATYSGDKNFKGSSFTVPEAVEDYSLAVTGVPEGTPAPTAIVSQGSTSADDPFSPLTIAVTPASIEGFSGSVALGCNVAVVSAPSGATAPACNLVASTIPVASSGTQASTDLIVDATKATPGLYSVTVQGTDSATGLVSAAKAFDVFVRAVGGPLRIVSGATTNNSAGLNFLLPPGVSISNLQCVSVTGTGIKPPGVPPSTLSIGCIFNPTTLPASSSLQSASVTVTVTTGGSTTASASGSHNPKLMADGLLCLPIFGFFGLLRGRKSRNSIFFRVVAILVICVAVFQMAGCGGSFQLPNTSGGATPPGAYTLLIQGTGSNGQTYQAVLEVDITL